jgi:hypothetical protein
MINNLVIEFFITSQLLEQAENKCSPEVRSYEDYLEIMEISDNVSEIYYNACKILGEKEFHQQLQYFKSRLIIV